ncbi:MAG: hypothetical protein IVW52_12305 [Acidimicrobiales bacterium]|nr:hypothetical protein [Acidimicrobiales bacterium]
MGEDAFDGLRREYRAGAEAVRRKEILHEASAINEKLRAVVSGRQELLATMMQSLEEKAVRYGELLAELDAVSRSPRRASPGRSGAPTRRRGRGR